MPSLLLAANYTFSTYTLSGACDRVLGDLGLRNNNFVTSGDIRRWLNEAQTTLARDTRTFHVTTASGVTSGVAEYPIINEAVGRAIAIEEVRYDTSPLCFRTIGQLDAHYPFWRSAGCSTPFCYYVRGFSCIGLYPTPDADDADILTVTYTAIPPEITEPGQNFYVLHGLEDGLITYAKLQASLKDAFGEGARRIDYYQKEWDRCQARAQEIAGGISENEVVRMGENALLDGGYFGSYVNPESIATSL